jgi:hypothetical protein
MYAKQVTIRLDDNLYRLLEKEAGKRMRSVAGLVRLILHRNLKNNKSAPGVLLKEVAVDNTKPQTGFNRAGDNRERGTE